VGKVLLFALLVFAPLTARPEPLEMHVVPLDGVKSYRLLWMSMDDEGYIWVGSIHHVIHRYDPRTGAIETIPMPFKATTSACICAGRKVYLLGQKYPKLMVYHRDEKRFTEHAYPSAEPDVWYGTDLVGARYLYLVDRGSAGIIKWDTQSDTGTVIPYPYKTPLPTSARYEPRDGTVWCSVWDIAGGLYLPVGIAQLDPKTDTFQGFYPWPKDDAGLEPYADARDVYFLPYTLKGKLVPFDLKAKRWCKFVDIPEYGRRFGFVGGGMPQKDKVYFPISTYDGDDTGVDGKPYHFCNGVLAFDTVARTFDFPTLDAPGAYHQIAYLLSAGGEFFATGVNILQPDGTLKQTEAGQAVFWQTKAPTKDPKR
jgi:hypothetical protein